MNSLPPPLPPSPPRAPAPGQPLPPPVVPPTPCLALLSSAFGQTVPVALNLPATVSADVLPGATTLDLPFSISGADSLQFDLIVPVDGATLALLDPAGAEVLAAGDPRLAFHPGSAQQPPLPGGVFVSPTLADPADGTWTLRLRFPPAGVATVGVAAPALGRLLE